MEGERNGERGEKGPKEGLRWEGGKERREREREREIVCCAEM